MTSEKQNKNNDWKARLDAMEHFDGEPGLDKTSSWERIHQRLYGKSRSKKSMGYWAVAACVGLIFVFLTIRSDRKPLSHGKSVPAMHSVATQKTPSDNDQFESASRIIISDKRKIKGISPNKKLVKEKVTHHSVIETEPVKVVVTEIPPPSQMEINRDSSTKPTSTAIILKKLPVVHINELEENENSEELIVNEQRTKDSKIRIRKDRKSTKQALAISGPSSGHLTIQISLNN